MHFNTFKKNIRHKKNPEIISGFFAEKKYFITMIAKLYQLFELNHSNLEC